MEPIQIIILALATWRITSLLSDENGPWDIFAKFRNKAGVKYNEKNEPYPTNEFSKQLACVWCLSLLVGLFVLIVFLAFPKSIWAFCPFAFSAFSMLADKQLWRGYKKH